MELTVRLVMLSDWHVGTGSGVHGMVDRAVQRDRSGLPYVPAKSVTGVWRDACEIAAAALDGPDRGAQDGGSGHAVGSWQAWVEYLFGSQPALEERGVLSAGGGRGPRPAALLVGAAHYPPAVVAALGERPLLKASAVFLKPGVKIDPATGAAERGMLRLEEMGRLGAVLSARVSLPGFAGLDAGQQTAVRALLAAGAGLVEGLGGKRRRGAGRCRLEAPHLEPDWEWLKSGPPAPAVPGRAQDPTPGPLPPAEPRAAGSGHEPGGERDREWEIADLRLVLEQPVVAHERTVGNAVRSLDHVPGWMLLPAVLERIGSPAATAAAREGRLVVTNALPEIDSRCGRPVPMALLHAKDDPFDQRNLMAEQPGPGFAGEPFDGGHVGAHDQGAATAVRVREAARSEHTHNTVDDPVQRPTERVGGLYTYQAIAEGTVLRAQVRVPAGVLPDGWTGRLAGGWRLGRSRKDGYGRVRVTATEAAAPLREADLDGPLRVWLLSDVLVYDARLRPSTDPADLAEVLGRALGVRLAPSAHPSDGRAAQAAGVRRHDPWHRRWGLPRHSLLGLKAGSCLQFDVTAGDLDPRAVARVEITGIGLRRAEGFGQVLIGDPLLSTALSGAAAAHNPADVPAPFAAPPSEASGAEDGEDDTDAAADRAAAAASLETMVRAAWRQEIHRTSEALAAGPDGRDRVLGAGHDQVPLSQLGALRTLLHQLTSPQDPRAQAWLDRLTTTEIRRQAWPEAVRDQLRRLLTGQDTVWGLLDLPEDTLTTGPLPAADMRNEMWAQAVRAVVEDCLTAYARDRETR
ncbi:RAMP superfamily CRISPR-associated protein [Streptomyces sp. NPDC002742]|uniref:RAMP superfamily CRISPR-associated protein n=1 Tax=Streptomyces sp. NPDC002742 TaxID=3364663 RepID=UPI0036CF5235